MTRADSVSLGRSRDTLVGAARPLAYEPIGTPFIPMRVRAWGLTGADVEHAIHKAGQSPSRNAWRFVEIERLTAGACPLNVRDGRAVAADAGYDWAYVVYPARGGRS